MREGPRLQKIGRKSSPIDLKSVSPFQILNRLMTLPLCPQIVRLWLNLPRHEDFQSCCRTETM